VIAISLISAATNIRHEKLIKFGFRRTKKFFSVFDLPEPSKRPRRYLWSNLVLTPKTGPKPVLLSHEMGQFFAQRTLIRLWRFLVCFILNVLFFPPLAASNWIDPDTPLEARTTQPLDVKIPYTPKPPKKPSPATRRKKTVSPAPTSTPSPSLSPTPAPTEFPTFTPRTFELVFSDEFNTAHRTFEDGSDPRWTAMNKNYYTNDALHYYSPDNVRVNEEGELVIHTEAADTDVVGFDDVNRKRTHVTKHFRSAMLQSWNKFCFTGGIIEAEVILPGQSNVGGLWPAFWLLGNLARHTYVGSSQHIWPWSSVNCTQKSGYAQAISGCDRVAHYGLATQLGRGAPEMDIFEVQPGNLHANQGTFLKMPVGQPFMSSSFQVAPGRASNRPGPGEWPGPGQWYEGLMGGRNTSLNILFYGNYNSFLNDVNPARQDYWSDAISYNRQLNADHFQKPHRYRMEWDVPTESSDGYLNWFLDDELVLAIDGTGIKKAGLGSEISSEPSYIILNTAVSKQWGFPEQCPATCPCDVFDCHSTEWSELCGFSEGFCDMLLKNKAPEYKVNWIRVYQDPNRPEQKVGCSTPERPTRRWIDAHADMYKTEEDSQPLKGIATGLGSCNPMDGSERPEACGGSQRGRCTQGRVCECVSGWTGPHCLSRRGFDSVLYDQPDKIKDVGFVPPKIAPRVLIVGLATLTVCVLAAMQWKQRFDGWQPIPEIEWKKYEERRITNGRYRLFQHSRSA
jgi:beta-glucanase (GH16 family)